MGSPVSLVRCSPDRRDLADSITRAINLVQFKIKNDIGTVIIKPNLNYYWEANTGCTTDPQVVGALVDGLRDRYGKDLTIKVAEADASAMRTKHVFPMLGYDKLAKEKNLELVNLSKDVLEKQKIKVEGHEIEFDVPRSLLNADLFINVPKLKAMRVTKITCAMKNMFGCIAAPRKFAYHPLLNEAIVGINKILHPHLTVVDGLVGLGRFPVKLNLIMASVDVFSVDWIVALIVGHNPREVRFLKIAMREKLGNPVGISTIGEQLGAFKKEFPREGLLSQKLLWSLQFRVLRLYKRLSGDVIPPFLEEE
jgi:uncharacterized protein (DUF362 family)